MGLPKVLKISKYQSIKWLKVSHAESLSSILGFGLLKKKINLPRKLSHWGFTLLKGFMINFPFYNIDWTSINSMKILNSLRWKISPFAFFFLLLSLNLIFLLLLSFYFSYPYILFILPSWAISREKEMTKNSFNELQTYKKKEKKHFEEEKSKFIDTQAAWWRILRRKLK